MQELLKIHASISYSNTLKDKGKIKNKRNTGSKKKAES